MPKNGQFKMAENVRRIGHLDLPGGGQVVVKGNYAYVGHMKSPHGTSIIDISDPTKPKVVATIEPPSPYSHTHKARVAGDLLYTNVEQDNRHFGPFAKVPVLEPSDSQECKDFVGLGLELSEEFDTPVIIRLTTRTSHAKSVVYLGERSGDREPEYEKDIKKRLCLPAHARLMHAKVEERMKKLAEWADGRRLHRQIDQPGAKPSKMCPS